MGTALRELIVSVSADTRKFQSEMQRAGQVSGQMLQKVREGGPGAARAWDNQTQAVRTHANALEASKQAVGRYAVALGGIFGAGKLIGMADEWGQINSRLKLATESTAEFEQAQGRLEEIAGRTYRRFSEAAEQFSQTARPMKELGFATRDTLDSAEALGLALVAGGSNAQKGATAIDAWGKSIAQGRIATEQFTSLLLTTPRVAQALADGLGKTTGELMEMAKAGQLTAQVAVPALISQMEKLRKEADALPVSVEDASIRFQDALQKWAGGANEASGATQTLIQGIELVTDHIDTLATLAISGGIGLVGSKIILAGKDAVLGAQGFMQAATAQRALTAARVADAREAVVASALRAQELVSQRAFYASMMATATSQTELSYATRRHTAIAGQAAAAIAGHQASIRGLDAAQRAATASASMMATTGRAALGILGGPAGLAITVGMVAAGWLLFRDNTREADRELLNIQGTAEETVAQFRELNAEVQRGAMLQLEDKISGTLADVNQQLDEMIVNMSNVGVAGVAWDEFQSGVNRLRAELAAGKISSDEFSAGLSTLNERTVAAVGGGEELAGMLDRAEAALATTAIEYERQNGLLGQFQGAQHDAARATDAATAAMRAQAAQASVSAEAVTSFVDRMNQEVRRGQVQMAQLKGGSVGALKQEFGQYIEEKGGVEAFSPAQIRAVVAAYRERRAQLVELEAAQKRYSAAAKETSKATRAEVSEQDKWLQGLNEQYAGMVENLQQEIALHGQNGQAAQLSYTLANTALSALSQTQKDYLLDLARQREIQEANARATSGYQGLVGKYSTPEESAGREAYGARTDAYMALLNGDIDTEGYDRLMERIDAKAAESLGNISTYADQAARNLQSYLGETMYEVLGGNFDNIVDRFADMLQRMAAELIASQILEMMAQAFSGGAGAGGTGWGGFFAAIGSAIAGNRAGGGVVEPFKSYNVVEHGDPELLQVGGRTTLMMGSKGGVVSPLMQASRGGAQAPAANSGTVVEIHNHGGEPARSERGQMPDGRELIRVFIGEAARDVSSGGSIAQALEGHYGMRRRGFSSG